MATLHIQHPVTDFDTWTSAFQRFADARRNAGVRAQRVQRPVDDPKYVVIDLDFDTTAEARSFQGFLTAQVWADPKNSPGLAGTPEVDGTRSRCDLGKSWAHAAWRFCLARNVSTIRGFAAVGYCFGGVVVTEPAEKRLTVGQELLLIVGRL